MSAKNKPSDGKIPSKVKLLSLFIFLSVFVSGIYLFECFYGDDAPFHFERLQSLAKQLQEGVWRPIVNPFVLDGYGYANDLFYGNFYLYPFAGLIALGMDANVAYFLLSVTLQFATLGVAYFSAIPLFNLLFNTTDLKRQHQRAAYFSLLMFFYFSRLYNVASRFAIGEVVAMIFVPLLVVGILTFLKEPAKKVNHFLALSFSLILLSHLISFVMACFVFGIILIIHYKQWFFQKQKWLELIRTIALTIGATSFFLFPLLEQLVSNEFFYQVKNPHGALSQRAFSVIGTESVFIPLAIQGGLIGLMIWLFKRTRSMKQEEALTIRMFILFIYTLLLTTDLFPWQLLNEVFLIKMIQFPFRLLNISSVFFALGGTMFFSTQTSFLGIRLTSFKKNIGYIIGGGGLIFLIVFGNNAVSQYRVYQVQISENPEIESAVILPPSYLDSVDDYYTPFSIGKGEYLPSRLDSEQLKHREATLKFDGDTSISTHHQMKGITYEWVIEETIPTVNQIELPVIFYKGYQAWVNHEGLPISQSLNGLVQIEAEDGLSLQAGDQVSLRYVGTKLQTWSRFTSFFVIGGWLISIRLNSKRNK